MPRQLSPQEIIDKEMRRMNPSPDTLPDFAPLDWLQSLGRTKKDQQEAQAYANKLKQYGTDTSALEAMINTPKNDPIMSVGAPAQINPVIKDYLVNKYRTPASQPAPSADSVIMSSQTPQSLQKEDPFSDAKREALKKDAQDRQSNLGWAQFAAGVGDALARRSSANTDDYFNKLRNKIEDDTVGDFDKRKKQSKEDAIFKRQQDLYDPNSPSSQSFRKAIEANFPKIAQAYGDNWQNVAASDQELIFKPLQLKETIDARKEQAAQLAKLRNDELDLKKQALNEQSFARALKQKEASTAQGKQRSNYEMGVLAENQYRQATADKGDYDPTNTGQIFDNDLSGYIPNAFKNNNAIAAHAAEDSWIETFLRDASGAAISEKERNGYRTIFFPQPGDSKEVSANKQRLREEKMNQARLSAGVGKQEIIEATKEDMEAVKWARANMQDPRAQKILKLHGM